MGTFTHKTISSKFAAAAAVLAFACALASAGFVPAQAYAATEETGTAVTATIQDQLDISLLSSSTDTSSVTGVSLGSGVTVYRDATIDQTAVYNAALKQVIKWRQDALDDTNVKWLYNGSYVTMKEYLSKKGISQSDYLNPKWSNALERIAIQRAAEAWSSSQGHTRPNSTTCWTATYNGIQSYGEILAWGSKDMAAAIDLWATEKSDYLKEVNGETHGVTGHYTQLINPSYKYHGFAKVGNTYAGEAGYSLSSSDSTTPTKLSGSKTFEVALTSDEVDQGTTWAGKDETADATMVKGSSKTYGSKLSYGNGAFYLKGGTWKSSDTAVATVSSDGKVTAVDYGTAKITYTNSGSTYTLNLTVGKADISKATVTLSPKSYTYTGSACEPTPTVSLDGVTLVKDSDYEVSYSNNINAGTATATITGKGNYEKSASATFTISPVAFSTSTTGIKLSRYSYEWTGSAITPEPTVTYTSGGVTQTLVKDKDYTVSYSSNTNIGSNSARAIVTGKGNFSSYVSLYTTFSITKATPSYTVPTGLTAACGQTLSDVALPSGFTWNSPTTSVGSAGTHTFYATYTPSDTTHYKTVSSVAISVQVNAAPITASMFTVDTSAATYTGSAITKSISSTLASSNYTVAYANNTNVGTATITITGKNNYTGTLTYTFDINQASLSSASVSLSPTSYTYDGSAKKPAPTVKLGSKTLTSGTDYTITYANNTNAGTAKATITGKGNYTGTFTENFTINKATLTATYPGETISYGSTPAFKVNVTGFVNGETASTAAGYKAPTITYPSTLSAGSSYTLTPASGAATNYNFKYVAGKLTVSAADLSNSAKVTLGASSVTYSGVAITPAVHVALASDAVVSRNDYDVAYSNNINAGTATVTVTFKGNYSGQAVKTFEITKAPLTATYSGETVSEGEAPKLYVEVTGFVGGENASTAKDYVAPAVSVPASLEVGQSYTLTPAGGSAANYSFSYVAGTLKVEKKHVHDYKLVETVEPTCTQAGLKRYRCSCGSEYTESLAALGHNYETRVVEPTCTEEGKTVHTCSRCGAGYESDVVAALGHEWGEWVVTKEATVEAEGVQMRTCTRCSATEGEVIPKLDPVAPETSTVTRLAGEEADATSAAISAATYENSNWVILARMDDFADAMSSTGLAGVLNAPIVLTDRYGLSASAAAEIERLGAKNVYIIGGTGAMPGDFENQLAAVGVSYTERIYGTEYYDTSVECANKLAWYKAQAGESNKSAIIAYGQNFQDALSISSYAYKYHVPILLETTGATSADRALTNEAIELLTTGAFADASLYVPGGPGAVSYDSVERVFGDKLRGGYRIYGETGYDTSNALATFFTETGELSASTACIATGAEAAKGVDALAGAALAGKNGGVMLLTSAQPNMEAENYATIDDGADSQGNASFLEANASLVKSCYILGGTYVLPDAFRATVDSLLS